MKVVATGDWHLGLTSDSKLDPETGLPTKVLDTLRQMASVYEAVVEEKAEAFIHAGDVFDMRSPRPFFIKEAMLFLQRIAAGNVQSFVIQGNHDNSDSSAGALAPIAQAGIELSHVFIEPANVIMKGNGDCVNVVFLPHLKGQSSLSMPPLLEKVAKASLKEDCKNVLVCHHTIEGAVSGAESTLMGGREQSIPLDFIRRFDLVVSGHIHKHQAFRVGKTEVVYTGSPIRCDFGERREDKGFLVIDTADLSWEFRKLDCQRYVQVNIDINTADVPEGKLAAAVKGAVVKVVLKGRRDSKESFDLARIAEIVNREAQLSKVEWQLDEAVAERSTALSTPYDLLNAFLGGMDMSGRERSLAIIEGSEIIEVNI